MSHYCVWVGGLKGIVQEKDLNEVFSPYGRILHIKVARDQETHKSKHCGFVVYGDEHTAESVARSVNGQIVFGGAIKARGPAEQRRRGHTGTYDGTIGYVPTKENDRRPYTDCIHYVTGVCVDSSHCPYRHSPVSRDSDVTVCESWLSKSCCTDRNCPNRHPGPNAPALLSNDPVTPVYSNLRYHNQDDVITIASSTEYLQISTKFQRDWAHAKGVAPVVKAVFIIKNEGLERKWNAYKCTIPTFYEDEEDHYHGTKLCCNLSVTNDLCTASDCSICRISEHGFDHSRIRHNIPRFQRFGPGFYLAPRSSKSHDYTQGSHSYRALLLCSVYPGNKYILKKDDTSLNGPPCTYHSIFGKTGGSLNYEEIVLPKADAILPKYIILYRKDGEQKIAK